MALTPEQKKKMIAKLRLLNETGQQGLAVSTLIDTVEELIGKKRGPDGPPGPKGPPGPFVKGDKGDKGDFGMGVDGYTPIKGKDYFDGRDGYTPIKGKDYFDGKNGSPDTPDGIKAKILKLKIEPWIPVGMIKGLPEMSAPLPNLEVNSGGRGFGPGGGTRLEILVGGVSYGQDIRKIIFSGATASRNSDGVVTITISAGAGTVTSVASADGNATVAAGTTDAVITIVSAPKLQTARTIGGVSFDGTANITVASATGGFTVSGGDLALSSNNITMTGSIGATGARITKLWATDITVTNAISGSVTGNAGTATALASARTIGGVSFDGTANITVATATGGFTVSGGNLALGTNSLTLTGSIAATGARVTKGWFTDIESSNMPTVGGTAILTSLTAPQFTTIELGAASDTTLARVSAGVISIEGITIDTISGTNTLSNKTLTAPKFASGGFIADANGNELIIFTTTASAVNEITIANAATTGNPTLSTTGGDSVIDLAITPKGTNGAIVIAGPIKFTGSPTTDGTFSGPSTRSFNSGYSSTAVGDLVYLDSAGAWQKCDADASATTYSGLLGIAMEVSSSGNPVLVALPGAFVHATAFPTFTIGSPVYMSATAGVVTQTAPTTTDSATRVLGWGVHADKMYFFPSPNYITHT